MNNVLHFGRKALSFSTVVATILWSVGFAALVAPLSATGAVTVNDGDLIKPDTLSTVYYYKGGKRYTFPNEKTYKTWYKDFTSAGIKTITLSEIQNYPLSGNVTYRPGTRLVKITTDPKVYAVEPGGYLRWVKTEEIAKSLWGADWAKRVDDVSDAFFTNYKSGDDMASATFPNGSLLKKGTDYYYIDGGKKRMVSAEALTGNNFNTAFAVAVTDVSAYADGTALGTTEVKDVTAGATTPGTTTTSGPAGALSVAPAKDNPPVGGSVVVDTTGDQSGQRMAQMLSVNFTANGGDVKVTTLKVNRTGISKDGDVDQVYFADANGKVLAKSTSVATGLFTFSGSPIVTVANGTTAKFWILADINRSATVGSTIGFSLDAANIGIEGGGMPSGTAAGNNMTVAAVTDLGQLEIATSTPLSTTTVDSGKTDYPVAQFRFRAIDQNLIVKKVKFTMIGSISAGDLANFKLKLGGVQVDTTKAAMDNNTLSFDLTKDSAGAANADGGLKITAGQSKFLDIHADLVAGTNRTYRFSIQNQDDMTAWDTNYKVYVPVVSLSTDAFTVETTAQTTINTGTLTVSNATDAPTGNVALNATAVTLAKFKLVAAGENVKVTSLSVYFTGSDTTDVIKNTKLILDGSQVGTTVASTTALGSGIDADFTFTNNFIVKTGTPSYLQVVADLNDATLASGATVYATVSAGTNNAQGVTSLTNLSTASVTSNTLTISSGTPTLIKNSGLGEATNTSTASAVVNAKDVKIGSFVIQAGAGEGAKVTQIVMADHSVSGNMANVFNRLRLQHSGADLAPEVGTLTATNATTYTFSLPTAITLAKSEQYVVDVVADTLSPTNAQRLDINNDTTGIIRPSSISYQTTDTGTAGTVTASMPALQQVFVALNGTLTVANAGDTPTGQMFVMGKTGQDFFHFRLTADSAEDIVVTDLVVTDVIDASAASPTGALVQFTLYDENGKVGTIVPSLDTTNATGQGLSTAYAAFRNLTLTVKKGTTKNMKVMVDLNAYPQTYSTSTHRLSLIQDYDTAGADAIAARGVSSNTSLTTTSGISGLNIHPTSSVYGNRMDTVLSKITIAHALGAPQGAASAGTQAEVARFAVSNLANVNGRAATVNLLNVTISTSISQAAGTNATRNLRIFQNDTTVANQLATTTYNQNTGMPGLSDSVLTDGNFTDVVIDSGATRTFFVTLDTNDAVAARTLTVGIGATGVTWTDSYKAAINQVDGLPLTGKTLTY